MLWANKRQRQEKIKVQIVQSIYIVKKARKSYSSVGSSPSSLLFIVTEDPECILDDSAISGSFSSKSVDYTLRRGPL